MSRKTRKLMWSVPLIAAVAVIGALALFLTLQPSGAQAQEIMVPGPVTDLDAEVKSRTEIRLTWTAPTTGGTPTGYRIDHSADNRVWSLLEDNTNSTATHFMVSAEPTTERYYRVFAINQAGTGPVSVDPVTAYASVPVSFPPDAPGRVRLTLMLDAKDPYGKIIITWTEPDNNGSPISHYKIVEMIDNDGDGNTARVECGTTSGDTNDPTASATPAADECLQIEQQSADDDRMAMHGNLTGGESHYYRVIAFNNAEEPEGPPSDTRGITTRTPRNPAAPTEPVAVPVAANDAANTGQAIELYWLHPTSTGGHPLGDFQVQVRARVRLTNDMTKWGAWTEWTSLNDATTGAYLTTLSGFEAKNGTADDTNIPLSIESDPTTPTDPPTVDGDGTITSTVGDPWNLRITAAVAGQYKFRIKSKQSGDADRGLDLESGWVNFNRASRAGLGYINYPVANIHGTEIPLDPELTARALAADEVKDQGIALTWDPDVTVRENFDHDDDGNTDAIDVTPPEPSDYRLDVSMDGTTWMKGQTRTISLRKWDHEGLMSQDIRYYRLFPINHGQFGEAAIAGGRAKKAVVASPDQVLNLRQKSATTTSITMEWDAIDAAAKYALYAAEPGEDDALPDPWPTAATATLEGTEYTDSKDLNPGDTRWYRVVPLSDDNRPVQGADGAEALGTADDAGEPGAPVGLVAQEAFDSSLTDSSDRGVLLLWDQPMDEGKDPHTSYTVQRMVDDGGWENLVSDTENLEDQTPLSTHYHDEEELGENEQRSYRVAALSGSGVGPWSNVDYHPAMTYPAALTAPTNVMATDVTTNPGNLMVQVTWTPGASADGGHLVLLFASDFEDVTVGTPTEEGTHTFSNVTAGDYVAVVVSIKTRSEYLYASDTISVGQ